MNVSCLRSWSGLPSLVATDTTESSSSANPDTQLLNAMQWHATATSVVTSVSKIRLWQNGVTDDEWCVTTGCYTKQGRAT